MKNIIKFLAGIAVVLVIAFSMAVCDDSGGPSEPPVTRRAPDVPTGITAWAISSSSIGISWNSVTGADGYRVYQSSSSSGTYSLLGTTSDTSATNTSLPSSTTYYYKVSAYNSYGESDKSSYTSATTLSSGGSGHTTSSSGSGTLSNPYLMSSTSTWYGGYISAGSYIYYKFSQYSGFSAYIEWEDTDKNTSTYYNSDIQVGLGNPSGQYVVNLGDWLSGGGSSSTRNRIVYSLTSSGYYIIEIYGYSSGYYRIKYY